MADQITKLIVSSEWLFTNINRPEIIILDTSPQSTVNSIENSNEKRYIPSSIKMDIKEHFVNKESKYPNTFPSASQFQKEARALGINHDSHVILYDNIGVYTSPRAWWLFKTMGHDRVSVLDGGLPLWLTNGYPTVHNLKQQKSSGNFIAEIKQNNITSYDQVLNNIKSSKALIIDARSKGRFVGKDNEPRKNIQSGCIPTSVNLPYTSVLEGHQFKSKEALVPIFESITPPATKDLIFSCGSGTTACIIMMASMIVQENQTSVFDGSWTEWALRQNLLIDYP